MSKYEYTLDLDNPDSSHTKILNLVPPQSAVLELGCASGYMTRYMADTLGCRVVGVEIDEQAGAAARPFCEKMVAGNVETLDFESAGITGPYDVIVMADILEHLTDARSLLVRLRQYLAPEGFILVSIPNGVHGAIALEFLDGRAEYRDTGLLDNTHLHFFDKDSFTRVLDQAGYLVSHLDRVTVHPRDTELKTRWDSYPREVTAYIEKVNPEFQTYQFILKAFPTTETGWRKGLEDAVRSQREKRTFLESRLSTEQARVRILEQERDRLNTALAEKEARHTEVLTDEKGRLEEEIRVLHQAYSEKIAQIQFQNQADAEAGLAQIARLEQEKEDTHDTYQNKISALEAEMQSVHAGYRAEIDRQQAQSRRIEKAYDTARADLEDARRHARMLEERLQTIEISVSWRLIQTFRRVLDRCLPAGTRRRRLYQLSVLAPVVLLREGPAVFARRILARMPGRGWLLLRAKKGVVPEKPLIFPEHDAVRVSIVIPVFNKVDYTYRCLTSILEDSDTRVPYEVIVVDNASADDTAKVLQQTRGIHVISNPDNRGFVEACNQGAARAGGEFILFLNNDTTVTAQWLDRLLEPFENDGKTGITGAKLVYPDGSLQEAGNIVFADAGGWNYGRGGDPEAPEFNYRKAVDYCSGACLMIPRFLWKEIGGFDMRYAPAYYEDTDLCFSVRDRGYKVIYQPFARIVHHEGISAGTDINAGMKRFQQVNHDKFLDKWKPVLETDHHAGPEALFLARERFEGKIILVADHYAPTFDRDSGSLRMFSILKILKASGHKVIFWPENRARDDIYTRTLQDMGIETLYGDIRFDEYLREYGRFIDIIILSRPHVAVNMIYHARQLTRARIIYDTVDLHFLREQRRAAFDSKNDFEHWQPVEFFLSSLADDVLVVSPVEKAIMEENGFENKVTVISNVHEVMGCAAPFESRQGLLFIGGFLHTPNEDAMLWFTEQILPLIREQLGEIPLHIVGSHPTDAVRALAGPHVNVTGFVADVTPWFEQARVFVSPLRYGAGVKGKIGQSLSYGLPVVTTPVGAEGMGAEDGWNMCVARTEQEFADRVVALYRDSRLWRQLSENGMALIKERFSPEVIREGLDRLIGRDMP